MKKIAIFLLIVFIFSAVYCVAQDANKSDQIIRIHIRADNDSPEAQAVKLTVRDEINVFLEPILSKCKTKEEATAVLKNNLDEIVKIGEQASNTTVCARLCEETFPDRQYGDTLYPAGVYSALIVEIGQGKGANWWCVAFPPMCYTKIASSKIISPKNEKKIIYRSWLAEFLQRIGWIK